MADKITPEQLDEARARAIMLNDPNCEMYHWPGDKPRKWKSPGGAIYDSSELSERSADIKRKQARAIREADDALGVVSADMGQMEAMVDAAWSRHTIPAWREDTHQGIFAAIRAGAIGGEGIPDGERTWLT